MDIETHSVGATLALAAGCDLSHKKLVKLPDNSES